MTWDSFSDIDYWDDEARETKSFSPSDIKSVVWKPSEPCTFKILFRDGSVIEEAYITDDDERYFMIREYVTRT